MPVLTYDSETLLWKEKERSKVRAVQIYKFRGLMGIIRMDRSPECTDKGIMRSEEGSG